MGRCSSLAVPLVFLTWLLVSPVPGALALNRSTSGDVSSAPLYAGTGDLEGFRTVSHCDATVDTPEGWIFSPNYPSDYENFRTCTFTVPKQSSDVCTLRLTFNDFELEDSPGCFDDYLLLPDGQKICGTLAPDTTKTVSISRRHSSFTFLFSSNEAKTGKGFMVKIVQVPYTCSDDLPDSSLFPTDSQPEDFGPPAGRPHDFDPPVARPQEFSPVARPQAQTSGSRCDREILGYTHVLSSPGYPFGYPPNQRCAYRVWRADRSVCTVELDVRDFALNDQRRYCAKDYLDLPDGTRFCGEVAGTKLLEFAPGSDSFTMTFVSDLYGSGRGFNVHVRQRPNSCGGRSSFGTRGCDQRLVGPSGLIRSPGYPRMYGPNMRCRYTLLRLNSGVCRVQISFKRFSLENSYGCRKDYLELPDRSRLCGRYAGTRTYDFKQDFLNLYFISDRFRADSGFEIEVRQLQNSCLNPVAQRGCDRTVSRDIEIIRSPEYPSDYPSGSYCVYTIRRSRPGICQVRLDMIDFDVEDGLDCQADSLTFENSGERLCGFRSGSSKVLPFPREADELRIVFTSDHTTNRKGFEIKVTQEAGGCFRAPLSPEGVPPLSSQPTQGTCGRLHYSSGVLESPRHPFAYPPNLDCHYWIHRASPGVCRAQLRFSRFDVGSRVGGVCASDYLDIQGTRYCGRRDGQTLIVDFPQGKNSLELILHSDSANEKSGFHLDVTQMTSGCLRPPLPGESCDQTVRRESFQLMSPGFRQGGYPPSTHCVYTVKKHDFRVCALEVKMDAFDLEQDSGCSKDYLQFNNLRFCGKQAYGTTRTIEFLDDEMKIQFHANPTVSGAGFLLSGKQVIC
ncbi:unnamed protein product [Ixodes hexagonus]